MKSIKIKLKDKGVYFSTTLPSWSRILKITGASPLVISDRKLLSYPEVTSWLKKSLVYFVSGGEKLKNLDSFSRYVNSILKQVKNKKISGFVSLGGGSVGDFTGFLASVYKRGTPLIHIPSTWLSAMDSAHGGKTALNVGQVKNVLGSYCFPKAVFIVKPFLFSLPEKESESARGELIKIALIEGGSFYNKLIRKKVLSNLDLWSFLPQAVLAKLKITEEDPYEKKGFRRVLNFGHTMGHVLESYFGIQHGKAVLYGIMFSIQWSHNRFKLSPSFLKEMSFLKGKQVQLISYLKKIPKNILNQLLLYDKKRIEGNRIDFVFIRGPGRVFVEQIFVQDILKEVQNQINLYK